MREPGNEVAMQSLLSSSLSKSTLEFTLESNFDFDLLLISTSKKVLFVATSDIFGSQLLLALAVLLSFFLIVAKTVKKLEDKLLSDTPIRKLGLTICLIIKSLF